MKKRFKIGLYIFTYNLILKTFTSNNELMTFQLFVCKIFTDNNANYSQ